MDELKPTSRRRQEYTAPLSAPPLRASLVERAETAIRNPDVEKHLRMLLARYSKIRARFERPYARLREISPLANGAALLAAVALLTSIASGAWSALETVASAILMLWVAGALYLWWLRRRVDEVDQPVEERLRDDTWLRDPELLRDYFISPDASPEAIWEAAGLAMRERSLRVECDIARRERERAVTVTARRIAEWAQLEEDLASVRAEIAELLDPEPVIPPRARA
ncbi:hypothetical protein E4U02_07425 [Microbacterium paludicola]|uniref:SLATT domain-containing protein n=1 Tax=Microbacterium paludicola TaxID=300019 RepID=A0A4Y9FUP4_9MICO|nr:hypothetical protein [Microbacterium paludicola]MBF0816234.1 hypothetical protein [Microbacterium paludicola]TFU33040.1 hypothetical protein E4U02_07425 [Microbacterium paludicola]